jgi:hemophore-related protein
MTTMAISETTVRRGLYGMLAGGLIGGAATAMLVLPSAKAAPDQCNASGLATTQSTVQTSMSTYLQTHPQADQALTDIAKQPAASAPAAYSTYFAENPTVAADLKDIQQPVTDLATQCGIQTTSNQQLTDALTTF